MTAAPALTVPDMTGARLRLIVALDTASVAEAEALVDVLSDHVGIFKIGLELIYAGGLDLADRLVAGGHRVFLDAKLLDIGNTVERATARAADRGISMLTIHGHDRKTLDAAVRGRGSNDLDLLAVTVMTNLDASDLHQQGSELSPQELVIRRAKFAAEAGFAGVVASGHEAAVIRREIGPTPLIVTPGIRPAGADRGDQARVVTPSDAIGAGASHLVVGRPITQAARPAEVADDIVAEIAALS